MTIPSKAPLPEEISLPIGYHSDFLKYGIRQPVIIKPFAPPAVAICGASGSGKTFALAVEYIMGLLQPGAEREFEHTLAVTFTNKATASLCLMSMPLGFLCWIKSKLTLQNRN